jgi:hydrophobic/amphiphilic exporter-1 (mainly G- bacteria), HAE1 family
VWLTIASFRNPIVVTLFYLFVGAVGLVAFARMGRSILPPVSFPVVTISAPYAGAGSEEIERLVVAPIEEKLDGIPEVDRISSFAQDGIARIDVRFRFGSRLEADRSNTQQAVDAARANVPTDLLPPSVAEQDPSQAPVLEAAVASPVLSPRTLAEALNDRILPALRASPGVGLVTVSGEPVRQFTVTPRPGALDAAGVSALDVFRTLVAANDVLPGGRLRSNFSESSIGIRSEAQSVDDVRALPVLGASRMGAAAVRIGDVAVVVDDYADPTALTRVDGQPAVVLSLSRAEGADALGAIASASRTLKRLAASNPSIRFETLNTIEPKTSAAIAGVLQTLGEGIVLTVLVILVFLHSWRNAAIAAIAIPASILATFVAMWVAGFTIDVLSLMGLSLTAGILVDDSVVIIEAIGRNAARGMPGDEAALAGRRELGGAAVAITLVDVAVFAPIAFTGGIVGEFMREFGLVVVFATAFSLLVSLTLTPLLAARWALPRNARASDVKLLPWMLRTTLAVKIAASWNAMLDTFGTWEERLAETYARRWLPAAFARGRIVFAIAASATVLSLVPLASGAIGMEFSPPVDRGEATVDLRFPPGTPLERGDAVVRRLSERLLGDAGIAHVIGIAGRGFNGSYDTSAANLAQITAVLADSNASGDAVVDRIKAMQALAPDVRLAGSGRGMGGTAPIRYTIAGSRAAVDTVARHLADALEASPFAMDVRLSDAGLMPRVELDIDPRKAVMLGVAADDAAQTARIATGGAIATRLRLPGGLTDVLVRAESAQRGDLDGVLHLSVRDANGRLVPLADLADVKRGTQPAIVERENGERVVTVTANALPGVPIGRVTGPLARKLLDPAFLPAGARVQPRGDVEQLADTIAKMGAALALALVVVYGILAVLYRSYRLPCVVMATVPLASVGAFGALYAFGQPLNLYSMLGIVMLVGLVSKNGILLVEYAQREIRRGQSAQRAMQAAARRRFRPIVMTTAAMIAGMLPLALGHNIGAEYRQAMGTVVIGGLSSSLLLTLFVVPLAYARALAREPSKTPLRPLATGVATRLEAPVHRLG